MIIEVEMYEKIRHYHVHENKSQREIARLLGISRTTVKKYLDGSSVPWERSGVSGRKPYVVTDEIIEVIKSYIAEDETENIKKQKHTTRRIYKRLVEEHDFPGGESTLRPLVAELKQKLPKVFIPLSYNPAEAIQIDWGEATIYLNAVKTKVNLLCMRQCNSADIFVKAFYRQNEESFLEGLLAGLIHFKGSPKRIIFDNAKVAVKEGFGLHAKAQASYKAFAAHHAFKTEFCNIASGHEKGLVEGLVGFIRRNVLVPIPKVHSIEALNEDLLKKCIEYRKHKIKGRSLTVGEMYTLEQPYFTPMPDYLYDTSKQQLKNVDEFSLVRFDSVQYSVPYHYVGKCVSIKGYGNRIEVLYKGTTIASYNRSYQKSSVHYKLEHYIDIIERRPRSAYNAKPVKQCLSSQIMTFGEQLESPKEMIKLLRLCIEHGQDKIKKVLDTNHPNHLSIGVLTSMLSQSNMDIPRPLPYKNDVRVEPPSLAKYDSLIERAVAL